MKDTVYLASAMFLYLIMVLGIGVYYFRMANENSDNYFLGGRSLGPFVTALSAEASDMSGWLLMGLPGVAYFTGITDAFWTAVGLGVGTYVNWLVIAKRLRVYSTLAGNSITLPDYLNNRFKDQKGIIMMISAIFILAFFVVYAASCFVTVGKLFSTLFHINYTVAMLFGALFVILYTFMGGFLAESVSDLIQSIVMILALIIVLALGVHAAGGLEGIISHLEKYPGFLEFIGISDPQIGTDGKQLIENNVPVFGSPKPYGILTIISTLSWGLGYFGVPQVLLRFMAIRDPKEITLSRRIATSWVFVSLIASVLIGLLGRYIFPTNLLTLAESENIFILMATKLMPPFLAGIMMAGILAATMSSSDSYLLIASSAVAKNIYRKVEPNASDQKIMQVSRLSLIAISVIAVLFALDENSVIFTIVSFAWAGFGATFGPIMIFSLFYKKTSRSAAIGGMLAGGIMVFVWKMLLKPIGGVFSMYELFPSFIISCVVIVVLSQIHPAQEDITKDYEAFQKELKKK